MTMVYTFKKLQLKKVPSCIGWYLSITSINDLFRIAMNEQTNCFVKKAVYSNRQENSAIFSRWDELTKIYTL